MSKKSIQRGAAKLTIAHRKGGRLVYSRTPLTPSRLRRVTPEARFSTAKLVFNANISLPFQAFPKPSAHLTKLCLAVFCKFLGDFWGCFGRDSFSQRISKIWRNKKY